MNMIVLDEQTVHIPAGIEDLKAFRHWAHSDAFPEYGRICFLNGKVWVDLSKEPLFSHNQVKSELNMVLGGLVKANRLGRYIPDGMLLTNEAANLTAQPDGVFVSTASLQTGRVQLVAGAKEGYVELEGTPDMVLEVVSTSSVNKDTVILRDLYWQAGITEYWLVDARGTALRFPISRHSAHGYVASRPQGGWVKSTVFGKLFRLTQKNDPLGYPEYTLATK
jgi:Uma2 family endonuclease